MPQIVIAGAAGGSPNRLEINDFIKDHKQFSLYIQALQYMYSHDSQDKLNSFFSVAGIHGLPYTPWDDSAAAKGFDPDTWWGGYCTHGTVLFPTWHRPYVALYEQILHEHALEIAATYKVDQASWVQAATSMRQPYWDWAAQAVPPPEVISLDKVTITTPDGKNTAVDNPLRHYTFHPISPSFPAPYNKWQTTRRYPTRTSGKDDVNRLKMVMQNAQSDITTKTYNLLMRVHTWNAFSNHSVDDGGSSSNSLEAIHDGIHVNIGGSGHMSDPSVAGFDPIFFLHHANVDRLLSIWSALNPGVWVSNGNSEDGTFTLPPSTAINVSTTLAPFWNSQTSFWNSVNLGDSAKLGYTYPDFNGLDSSNPDQLQRAMVNRVNSLYGSSMLGGGSGDVGDSFIATSQAQLAPAVPVLLAQAPKPEANLLSENPTPTVGAGSRSVDQSNNLWEWAARVHVQKYALGSSFSILFFLGEVPDDPYQWLISPNLVGTHQVFANSVPDRCSNCRDQSQAVVEGFIHLNNGIRDHSNLNSLEPNVVKPFLTEKLHWRVMKVNGEESECPSLHMRVSATPLSFPPGAIFPVPGEPINYPEITQGRSG